ncbi:MAG: hypothetical protein WC621_03225 [Patescibacteria group bacterium]
MKIINILFIALMAFTTINCKDGCNGNKDEAQAPSSKQSSITDKYGKPGEYFPMDVGRKWTYNIKLTDDSKNPPLAYGIEIWPMGENKNISYETRGLLYGRDKKERNPQLIIQVDSLAAKQGPLHYPMGVRLKIIRDDLGIYGWPEYNEGVYWAVTTSGRWQVTEVVLRDPMSPGAPRIGSWGGWGGESGFSLAMKFFGARPGLSIGIGSDSHDALEFLGPEDFGGSMALHFKRVVDVRKDSEGKTREEGYLGKSFTEDMWYLRHVGLVRLVQTVDKVETMVWTLEGY